MTGFFDLDAAKRHRTARKTAVRIEAAPSFHGRNRMKTRLEYRGGPGKQLSPFAIVVDAVLMTLCLAAWTILLFVVLP